MSKHTEYQNRLFLDYLRKQTEITPNYYELHS